MSPNPTWHYMIGVDWNDAKIGTTIAVVGFNPQDDYFYLVDKHIVSRGDRTQLSACQKIAEVNRLWDASFIYVDQGYGSTQIEVLHDYGARCLTTHGPNHPDARLRNIVKGYDFGSSIEIHDLFTKQPVKKPSKPFLVENSVRRFESMQFKYPKSDENYTAQLLGYIIDRISTYGRPIYKAQNETVGDHFLDAVNLALVAFALEKGQFGKLTYTSNIAVAGKFGEIYEQSPTGQSYIETLKNHKPNTGRANQMQGDNRIIKNPYGETPGANMNNETTVRVWDWPGFLRDAPKPQARTLSQASNDAADRILGSRHRRNKPQRTKF
jgi:hypothetical protein